MPGLHKNENSSQEVLVQDVVLDVIGVMFDKERQQLQNEALLLNGALVNLLWLLARGVGKKWTWKYVKEVEIEAKKVLEYWRSKVFFIKTPLSPCWLLLGSPILMDPHPSQQQAGPQSVYLWPQQEVNRLRRSHLLHANKNNCHWRRF